MRNAILFVCLVLLPWSALAAGHRFALQAPGPNGSAGPSDPARVVADYLALTPEQGDAWRVQMEGLRAQQQPLGDRVRALEEQLHAALQIPGPDPAVVGALVIQIQGVRDQMRANEEAYRAAFEALLDESQRQRLYVLREASELAPLFPAFHDTRLL